MRRIHVAVWLVAVVMAGAACTGKSNQPGNGVPALGTHGALNAIACATAGSCVAVGWYGTESSDARHAQAAAWDGRGWRNLNPPGEGADEVLSGVTCPTSDSCVAVGFVSDRVDDPLGQRPLIETWHAGSWTVQRADASEYPASLDGVSCATAEQCRAVGWSQTPDGNSRALVEALHGAHWTEEPPASLKAGVGSWLQSIACSEPTTCIAVGHASYNDQGDGTGSGPLAELWTSGRWTLLSSVSMGNASAQLASFESISCPAGGCLAVGSYDTGNVFNADTQPLIESYSGGGWRSLPVAPQSAKALSAISCRTATNCVAVGPGVTGRSDGGGWKFGKLRSPEDPRGIACVAGGRCIAVGSSGRTSVAEWLRF